MLPADLPTTREAANAFYDAMIGACKSIRERRAAQAWLGREDLFFLLTRLLRRPDADRDWLFARCREVQTDPNDHVDLWSREHYKSTIAAVASEIPAELADPVASSHRLVAVLPSRAQSSAGETICYDPGCSWRPLLPRPSAAPILTMQVGRLVGFNIVHTIPDVAAKGDVGRPFCRYRQPSNVLPLSRQRIASSD